MEIAIRFRGKIAGYLPGQRIFWPLRPPGRRPKKTAILVAVRVSLAPPCKLQNGHVPIAFSPKKKAVLGHLERACLNHPFSAERMPKNQCETNSRKGLANRVLGHPETPMPA